MLGLLKIKQRPEKSDEFAKLVGAHRNSLCIVGNSPCELGSNNGAKIDAYDLVIRFNNFSVEKPFEKDYGTKTNIWVRSSPGSDVKNRDISGFGLIMFSGNFPHYRGQWKLHKDYAKTKQVEFFPSAIWHELIEQLQAPPSAGLLTLYTIFKQIGPIPRGNIFGFSPGQQISEESNAHYFDAANPGIRHNWRKEQEILESISKL